MMQVSGKDVRCGTWKPERLHGRPRLRWEDNIKVDYKERGWIHMTGQGPVVSSFEHGNKPLGFIKSREFVDQLTRLSASEEVLCHRY
jgi:hypothetical protein